MICRTIFIAALALLASSAMAAEERGRYLQGNDPLQGTESEGNDSEGNDVQQDLELPQPPNGVNMCANYDIVTPRIAGGTDSCDCDGRKLVCKFKDVCNLDNNCASLEMDIDFTIPDEEQIIYVAKYAEGEESTLTLDVSTNPEKDGIQGCSMKYAGADCTCSACAKGRGVKIACGGATTKGATSNGCEQVDVANFERYVPFFGEPVDTTVIAQSVQQSGGVATRGAAAAAAAVVAVAMAM